MSNEDTRRRGYTVLYVDDERAALATFENAFRREFRILTAQNGTDALRMIADESIGVLIADQRMPEMHGFEMIERARALRSDIVAIVLTGFTDSESLKQAINRAGAFQYIDKPWKHEELEHAIRRALDHHHLSVENARLAEELGRANAQLRESNELLASENAQLCREAGSEHVLVGATPELERVREAIRRAAPHKATVLVLGETGTGKEAVARAIHSASPRRSRPMVTVNCSAIPKDLIESELFGHEKGAFTGATATRAGQFAAADGGTIFLDEVGDLQMDLQPKLLRVLQEGEITPVGKAQPRKVDVRVVSATNRDLARAVREGAFREDLYHRLNVVPIRIPPLRDRRADIPLLVNHFLDIESRVLFGRGAPRVSDAALELLTSADYPGNVRYLRNLIVRVLINYPGEEVLTEIEFGEYLDRPIPPDQFVETGSFRALKDAAERRIIEEALTRCGGNKRRAARELRLSEQGLHKAIQRLGLSSDHASGL